MASEAMDENETSEPNEVIIPGYKSIADFTKEGYKFLMEGVKHSNSLPSGRDWSFYTNFESFKEVVNAEANNLMDSISQIFQKTEAGVNMRNHNTDRKTEILIDANDLILERVANDIDEMNGIKKNIPESVVLHTVSAQLPVNINGSWNRNSRATFSVSPVTSAPVGGLQQQSKGTTIRLLTAENIIRPQKLFKDKIDNSNDNPWEPRIKDKPNSLKPLAIFLEETEFGREFSHPYEYELDRFTPSQEHLGKVQVVKPKLIKDTPLVEISKPEQLGGLVEELRQFKTIAVDLEHHSYRTFMGITCLMQISTPEKDYLIDTLSLRSDLWVLNEIFTKPDTVKVFHGAISDIQWLQRDLSLYVVNMFDTHIAAKLLEYSGLSLAYLMQRFCNFMPNKQFQLADWRIRPLPEELKNYAREDTHYLIYIYQNMRNELINKAYGKDNLLRTVIQDSNELCKKRYLKPIWHENSHLEFYRRCHRMFDNRQMYALKEIYKWRDQIARIEDESTGYVLPNNMLLEISERLPREMQGILACCSPVPPLLKANLLEIHKIILKALEQPFEEPILKEDTRGRGSTKKMSKINISSALHCPHDLTKSKEFRDDLPTLLGSLALEKTSIQTVNVEKNQLICSVFDSEGVSSQKGKINTQEKLKRFKENFRFFGPYERYQLVKPFIEAREKKLAEEQAKKEEEERAKRQTVESQPELPIQEDTRTDEERIESIREHFLQLARKTLPPQAAPSKKTLSLLDMGGSKKRKRDESILRGHAQEPQEAPEEKLLTPVPNLQITLHTNTNKRRLSQDGGGGTEDPKNKVAKLSKNQRKRLNKRQGGGAPVEQQEDPGASDRLQGQVDPPVARGAKRGRSRPNRGKNTHGNAANNDFTPYDYSMVDFRQFQGGAKAVQNQKPFKAKFKGRGKPNRGGNRGHSSKSMTFGARRGR